MVYGILAARVLIYMARAPSDQSLLTMMSSPSAKNKRNNYSSGDVEEAIRNIETVEISQVKAIREYGIPRQTLERKCKEKRENVADKRTVPTPVLGEESDKDLVQFAITM